VGVALPSQRPRMHRSSPGGVGARDGPSQTTAGAYMELTSGERASSSARRARPRAAPRSTR